VCTVLPGAIDTSIYRHAANYVGRQIRPLPPVTPAQRVVSAVVGAVDSPKAEIVVGRAHHLGAVAHGLMPRLYDRLVGPVVDHLALQDAAASAHDGTVFTPTRPATRSTTAGASETTAASPTPWRSLRASPPPRWQPQRPSAGARHNRAVPHRSPLRARH